MHIKTVPNISPSHTVAAKMSGTPELELGAVSLPDEPPWKSSPEESFIFSREVLELELVLPPR